MNSPRARQPIFAKPEVMLLEDVLDEIAAGGIRIPKFQRPFVWRPRQMLELFDSIERGYPIGSVLLWQTDEPVEHLAEIGGLSVPSSPENVTATYVLDGHQRLSTLYGTLRRQTEHESPGRDWTWDIRRDLSDNDQRSNRFVHWKSDGTPPPWLLPMGSVLRTMDFLRFARDLESGARGTDLDLDRIIDRAEVVAQRLKGYKVSVIRLVGGELDQAVEVFARLNSSGSTITPDQMVSALTYQGGESLGERISLIEEEIAGLGFADVGPTVIFRAILATAGEEDILETRWEALARRVEGELADAVERTRASLVQAIEFLKSDIGVARSRLLPYSIQLVLLSTFFSTAVRPTAQQRQILADWFWLTSWSGAFAGANTTQVKAELRRIKEFARGDLLDLTEGMWRVRPFPQRFDLRSARVRCFLIWYYNTFSRPIDSHGRPFDAMQFLDEADSRAFRQVTTTRHRLSSNPANRVIFPTDPGVSVKSALLQLSDVAGEEALEGLGIPPAALDLLRLGKDAEFVSSRAAYLEGLEREFMRNFSIAVEPGAEGPEIDSD